jgi:DNA-binding NarL/FixJ family response regulator
MRKRARSGGPTPADLRGRSFVGADGRRYAALWWSPDDADAPTLTCAEREVARMMLAGWSNAAIAEARGVSTSTIANQARCVFAKLRVAGRAELVARMIGAGEGE